MSEFLEDPSVLTKDKLKSELLANNVSLPSGEHRKDVYVQLYKKTLTVQNKKKSPPDTFSSDEELPPPVVSNKSRSGRKATRKTDKPPADEVDVADLTDESLKEQLLKYGVRIGPVVASTRKLYEKKLQKLMEEGPPEPAPPPTMPVKIGSNQNGNTDSDQYSDKEEEERAVPEPDPEPEPEPEPVPVVEKPVRSRGKTPQRTRRQEYNRGVEELAEDYPVLNVKRKQRRSSLQLDLRVPARNNADVPVVLASKPVTPALQEIGAKLSKWESVALADPVLMKGASQEPKSLLVNTPSKPCTKIKSGDLCTPSSPFAHIASSRGMKPPSLHLPAPVESLSPVLTQENHSFPLQPLRQVEERVAASEKVSGVGEKDLLKELFPHEPGTPTGISATCRRPIRGAAGRPLPASDFWLNESRRRHSERIETSTYITETRTPVRAAALHLTSTSPFSSSSSSFSSSSSAGVPSTSPAHQRRSLPMWLQLLLLSVVAGFLFFVYQAMETNQASPFDGSKNLEGGGQ